MARGKKPPWFKFFPDWLLGSDLVREQRTDAVGAYVLLIASAWVRGLPDHDESLQRITGLGVKRWRALRPVLMAKFVKGPDGRLHHPVLDDLWADYQQLQATGRQTGPRAQVTRDASGRFREVLPEAERQGILPIDVTTRSGPKGNRCHALKENVFMRNGNGLQGHTPRKTPDRSPGKLEEEIDQKT